MSPANLCTSRAHRDGERPPALPDGKWCAACCAQWAKYRRDSRELAAARAEGAKQTPVWMLACIERGHAL